MIPTVSFANARRLLPFLPLLTGLVLSGCNRYEDTRRPLDFEAPIHFLSAQVSSSYPTNKAISNPSYLKQIEGASLSIQVHPELPSAQLRVVQLPKTLHATEAAAHVLAESGVIQDCDILTVYRPEWSLINGYGNIQLGQGHAAFAFIETAPDGKRYVHTVENPLHYSSRLNHAEHYGGHDIMNVIRPNLTKRQKANLVAWGQRMLQAGPEKVQFYKNYGKPYEFRTDAGERAPTATGSLPVDIAKSALYPAKEYFCATYCSELVWALLALRNINPDDVLKRFPTPDAPGLNEWLKAKAIPFVNPLAGATANAVGMPGLMQGPDLQLRRVMGGDDERRRQYLLERVLLLEEPNPAKTSGLMSSGHRESARAYLPKVMQLREFYGAQKESSSYVSQLNLGVAPNYSPTSFFILANEPARFLQKKKFHYVATVSFRPSRQAIADAPAAPAISPRPAAPGSKTPAAKPPGAQPPVKPAAAPAAKPSGSPSAKPASAPAPKPSGSPSAKPAATPAPKASSPSAKPASAPASKPGGGSPAKSAASPAAAPTGAPSRS